MKNFTILFSLLILTYAIGCTNRSINGYNRSVYTHPELNNAPSWVRAPNFEGGLAAIGSQKIGASGIDFARKNAIASARDSLASNIQIKVKNLMKNFTES